MTEVQRPQDGRRQTLEQQLLEGIESGPPEEVTPRYLAELFREAEGIIARGAEGRAVDRPCAVTVCRHVDHDLHGAHRGAGRRARTQRATLTIDLNPDPMAASNSHGGQSETGPF